MDLDDTVGSPEAPPRVRSESRLSVIQRDHIINQVSGFPDYVPGTEISVTFCDYREGQVLLTYSDREGRDVERIVSLDPP